MKPRTYSKSKSDTAVENFSWIDMFRALWYFLKGHRLRFITQLTIGIIAVAVMLYPPYALGLLGQMLLAHKAGESTKMFYVYVAALGSGMAVLGLIRNISRQKLKNLRIEVGYETRVEGFERLMNFSYAWHQEENSGVRVQRITTGVNDLRQLISMVYRDGVDTVVSSVGVFSLFFFVNWSVALVFAAYMTIVYFTESHFNAQLQRLSNQENAASEQTSGTYYESASNALTVKALGVQDGVKRSVIRSEQLSKERSPQTSKINSQKYLVYQLLRGFGLSIFLALVARQVFAGTLSAPFFITYYFYYYRMSDAASSFGDLMSDAVDVRAGIGRMMPIFWANTQVEGTARIPETWKSLELKNVSFTYPGSNEAALNNLSMSIGRGQKIGIAGRSGEGKSTLAKLLLSVYAPTKGTISIGGISLVEAKSAERIHRISAVLQETELFSLTLRENIEVFRGSDPERMDMAIRVAQLGDMVAELPKGMETPIGEKGYKLSGGQRQRVGIARAVYAHSDIIMMDEATSSLDSASEVAVQEGIERELKGRTVIMIAHRLSTLRNADIIYFVADGAIAESGSFDELVAKENGLFRAQYELQLVKDS
jgi:ABC-type multidrug transport system fused ATPase/permease subunit